MIGYIKRYIKLYKAIAIAEREHNKTGHIYYVIAWKRKLIVLNRPSFKDWKRKGIIDKSVTMNTIKRASIYRTDQPLVPERRNLYLKKGI